MKGLQYFLYAILTESCLVHILFIGNQLLHPNLPEIRIYKKYLKDALVNILQGFGGPPPLAKNQPVGRN